MGFVLVFLIIVCQLGNTVLAEKLLKSHHAIPPFFLIYFNVSWDLIGFAFYFLRKKEQTTVDPSKIRWVSLLLMMVSAFFFRIECKISETNAQGTRVSVATK